MLSLSPTMILKLEKQLEGRSWLVFLRLQHPTGMAIKIESSYLDNDTPFEISVVGLVETKNPLEAAQALQNEHRASRIRGTWFQPSMPLINFIEQAAQRDLRALIESMGEPPPGTITVQELADQLGVSVPTIYRWVESGKLPHFRVRRQIRFLPGEVLPFIRG
jgi:excisionase family DNA binding protein